MKQQSSLPRMVYVMDAHLSRDCPKRSLCEKCHRHHPSCLHDDYDKRYTEVRSIHKDDSCSDSSTGCTDHGDKDISHVSRK